MIGVGIFFGFILIEKKVSKEIPFKDQYKLHITIFLSFIFGFIGSRIFDIIFFGKELNFLKYLLMLTILKTIMRDVLKYKTLNYLTAR